MSSAGQPLDPIAALAAQAPQGQPQLAFPTGDSRNNPAALTVGGQGQPAQLDPVQALASGQAAPPPPPPAAAVTSQRRLPQWAVDMGVEDPWTGAPGNEGAGGALVNGITAGFGDEFIGATSAIQHNAVPFLTGKPTNFHQDYADVRDSFRDAAKTFAQAHPYKNMAMPLFAAPFMGVAGAAAAAPSTFWGTVAKGAATGGFYGGAAGFGSGEGGFEQRMKTAGKGAAAGAATGAVIAPLAYGAAKGATLIGRLLSKDNPTVDGTAGKILMGNLAEDDISPAEAAAKIGSDPTGELTLADIGGENSKTARLARALVTANTPVSKDITEAVNARDAAQMDRFSGAIKSNLSGDTDTYGNLSTLIKQRSAEAGPLYAKAYEGGSLAPFEDQLRDQLQSTTGAKGIVARQIREIEQNSPGALAARGAAGAETRARYMQLTEQLKQAEAQRQAVMEIFQRAKGDATSKAPGAVWSPRIQQFLDDPITKQGINAGLEVQRLEALAENKPFNPAEYGIVGTDEAGKPIVGAVPNMRLLNAAKIGMDNILEGYRDPVTLRLNLDQRGRAIDNVRKAFISELDNLNPDYKLARASWAGPSAAMDAVEQGQRFMRMDSEEIAQVQAGMSDAQKQFFRIGAGRSLLDKISKVSDGADLTKRIFGNPQIRKQISAAFGEESANTLAEAMASEKAMAETGQFLTGGSQTANKVGDFAGKTFVRKALADAIQGGTAGFMGGGVHGAMMGAVGLPIANTVRDIASNVAEKTAISDPETASALGRMLMAKGPQGAEYLRSSIIPFADRLASEQARRAAITGALLKAQPALGIAAGQSQK